MPASSNVGYSQYIGALMSLSLMVTGCSMFSEEAKLPQNAKGSIYLKEIADWSFAASHPAAIDQMTLLKLVKGVVTDDVQKSTNNMPASGSKPMRVFSDEDAEFLAPLLAQGLSQAKPEQIVGFKVSPSAGSGTEPTAGTLYVHKGSLYLTIAPFQNKRPWGFLPGAAARLEKAPSFIAMGSGAMTMVIDHQTLVKAPTPSSLVPDFQEAQTQSRTDAETTQLSTDELLNRKLDELREAREANKRKDSEIAMLKKETTWMKKELRQRTEEVKTLKTANTTARSAMKKKSAEAYPTR